MVWFGIAIRLLLVLAFLYLFLPIIARFLDTGLKGIPEKPTFLASFAERSFVYLLLPVLFATTSVGMSMLPNSQFWKELDSPVPQVTSPYPTEEQIAEQQRKFPLAKGGFLVGIIVSVFVVGLTRVVTVTHAAFLTRTMLFFTLGILGSLMLFLSLDKAAPTVYVDVVARNFAPQLAFPAFAVILIVALGIEGGLRFHLHWWGYRAGEPVPQGVYTCKTCLTNQYIAAPQHPLSTCTNCGHRLFRRVR